MLKSWASLTVSVFIFVLISFSQTQAASFSVTSPAENSSLQGNVVTVKFSLPDNLRFSTLPAHSRPVYGEGHIHMWLDTNNFSAQSAIHVETDSYVIENLKYGPHTLTAEWVSNNDTRGQAPIITSVSFSTYPAPTSTRDLSIKSLSHTFFLITILAIVSLYLISRRLPSKTKPKPAKKQSKK